MILGLTGGIACGKTTVSKIIKKLGIKIVDADIIAHEILELPEIRDEIKKNFGETIIKNNKVQRKELREIVFKDREKLKKLNDIVHPKVIEIFQKEFEENRGRNEIVVFDIPLLYEVKLEKLCDKVLVVYSNKNIQIERIKRRDKSSEEMAENVIKSQMDISEKVKKADYLIENNSTFENLEKNTQEIIELCYSQNQVKKINK